ncbi:ABC transporter permease [Aquabacter spiritensis]|uniref:NitT/TauT family transport system permease protein n=1 Tax=Aquabacter spiritensis TaxID=933073 RepID=A0A4R3M0R5_9HYPH|nr:ABC transporter permease [Aquabacter spiritensis]TCT06671.1 NitT/TauT family transport system permease protein [Aquabacter spiritensis]
MTSYLAPIARRLGSRRLWLPFIGPALLIAAWSLLVESGTISPILLPGPVSTLKHLWSVTVSGAVAGDFLMTLSRTVQAFLIATVIGVPLGVALGASESLYRSVEFVIDFFRSTPSSALIPLFMLIFGISDFNKIAISAFAAVLVILFNSAYGVMNAKRTRVMAATVMGATRFQVFRDVLLWESLPQTFVGLRSGISLALVIVVVAEMFIGSDSGLGQRIINAQQIMNVREMYGSILAAGVLGYVLNLLFLILDKKVVHWSGRA